MILFVKSFDSVVIDTEVHKTGADLKLYLADTDKLPLESLQLYSGSTIIGDNDHLDALPQNSSVDVVVPILGGKVHGSLARAGKVKGQTPKVEKQEKKKKPRGRAKRRMQYNKRFVAVVQQIGGRRRGPNANVKA